MEKIEAYGISPSSILLDYQTAGFKMPGGVYSTDYANSPIHVTTMLGSEREIADKIIWSDPEGNIIRLGDVATITRKYKDPSTTVNYNGKGAVILSLEMRPDNDIVAFGREVNKVLEAYEEDIPESVHINRITDQPKVVGTSVLSFLRDLVISILVVIMVMLMLFPIRSALIASSGVPVCTALTLALMFVTGIDLNTVSLAALIVVLGMIVDNSIITMDGYMDKLSRGMSQIDAAIESVKELFVPMLMSTLAICAMFFPTKGIITGYLGDFIATFPWVIAFALIISFVYAVTVVPSLEVRYIDPEQSEKENWFSRIQGKFFDALQNGYEKMEEICFRYPKMTILTGIIAVVLGLLMFTQLNVQMMPKAARDCFTVEMYLDGNSGVKETQAVSDSLQQMLLKDPRIRSITSFVGSSAPRFHATYAPQLPAPNFAQFIVNTTDNKATEEVLKEYGDKCEHYFTNALVRFKQMDYQAVNSPVEITIHGGDHETMTPIADSIKKYLYQIPELKWIHSDCDDYLATVNVDMDAEESARLGVNKAMLSMSLAGAFNGQTIASVWEDDTKVPVNLYSDAVNEKMDYDILANQVIPTLMPGISVPLRQIADIQPDWAPDKLKRSAGEDAITIGADMKFGCSQPAAMKKITKYIDQEIRPLLPEDVDITYGGLSSVNETVGPEIGLSFICAVAVLFFFMFFHFKKLSLATLTLILSSLCLFGAFFGMWIFRLDFGITSVLGLISLVGVIVRNGIIMFDYAEELRFQQGYSLKEAAFEAGKRRMRPIFLTSCTTALGVLPMIISGDALWMPMGIVICFGTMLSIFLIVLIMPVSYWQIFQCFPNKKPSKMEEITNEK